MDKKFKTQSELKAKSLTDNDISSQRRISRRSILSSLGVGLGVAALAVVGRSGTTAAQAPGGCSDNDGGRYTDPPGFGRHCQPGPGPGGSGCSDFDGGGNADPPGLGRSCRPRNRPSSRPTGCTDMDSGPSEDPPGYGVRCSTWI
jgi:hypothetical protein